MPVLGTLPDDKAKLVALYANENSQYETNLGSLNVQKRIAQNPNESPERRAAAKAKYEQLSKKVKEGSANLDKLQKAVDKLDGGKEVTKIQKQYKDLLEAKSLLLDPNDPQVDVIDKKIDKLADSYQNAYSKVIGTRVSRTVAKANLTGTDTTTFGKPSTDASAPDVTLTELKLPSEKKSQSKPTGTKTSTASTPIAAKQAGAKPFEQPMSIAGQVQTDTSGANADKEAEALNAASALDLAGTLFEHVPSLKNLLDQYVNKGWTNSRFLQELRNDTWYKKNSAEIKARYTQLYNYQDLVASGQADGTTDYEKQINNLKDQIIKKAREMGSGLASDPAAIQRAAENMYITNTGIDDALTTNILASAIRPIGSTIGGKPTQGYSGKALQDYQTIQAAAKANGFKVSDIIPGGQNELQVLQGIATGAIDVNRIAQDARKLAAQGQPQYVRDLLGQGYNLDQVYAPYRQTMANILEIGDPNQIDLNDPTLRAAITDKGDMNLYDFKKALRQDNRWQYTDTAKQEVSSAALNVLRDFGFQG